MKTSDEHKQRIRELTNEARPITTQYLEHVSKVKAEHEQYVNACIEEVFPGKSIGRPMRLACVVPHSAEDVKKTLENVQKKLTHEATIINDLNQGKIYVFIDAPDAPEGT